MQKQNETKKEEVTMKGKYLTPNEKLWDEIPKEYLTELNTWRILNCQEKALLTEGQLYAYERFWMSVVDERILREAAVKKSYNEGMEKGMEKGMIKERLTNASNLKKNGVPIDVIATSLGLTAEEVEVL